MTESEYANGPPVSEGTRRPSKKLKIYQEEAKLRQTAHWDLDYMTSAELDAWMSTANKQNRNAGQTQDAIRRSTRNVLWHLGLAVGALTLMGGLFWGLFYAKSGFL